MTPVDDPIKDLAGTRDGAVFKVDTTARAVVGSGVKTGEVHVWYIAINSWMPWGNSLFLVLSQDERVRAHRLNFGPRRNRFVITRALLRQVLGRYLGETATDIGFEYGDYGKPRLKKSLAHERLTFNVSHSHEIALLAVTREREIGIDVEYMRADFDKRSFALRWFSPLERAMIFSVSEARRERVFYEFWTRREAIIKASGRSVLQPLTNDLPSHHAAPSMNGTERISETVNPWSLCLLHVPRRYAATLALEGPKPTITRRFDLWKPSPKVNRCVNLDASNVYSLLGQPGKLCRPHRGFTGDYALCLDSSVCASSMNC